MKETLFTPFKGLLFLLALVLMLYPGILLLQVITGTVTESLGQIALLLGLSGLAWLWIIRLYRNTEFPGVRMKASE